MIGTIQLSNLKYALVLAAGLALGAYAGAAQVAAEWPQGKRDALISPTAAEQTVGRTQSSAAANCTCGTKTFCSATM